jgi:hypothetical protein
VTAVAEDTDLSWVTFTDGQDAEPCIGDDSPCPYEAVAAAVWHRPCACSSNRTCHCAFHRDVIVDTDASYPDEWRCSRCWRKMLLLRVVPIR